MRGTHQAIAGLRDGVEVSRVCAGRLLGEVQVQVQLQVAGVSTFGQASDAEDKDKDKSRGGSAAV